MTLDDNRADLEMHARHFAAGLGFTYTVRAVGDGDVIGCVYIYPSDDASLDAQVRSWVRVTYADLDSVLAGLIADWLARDWPFTTVRYR
jgi:hypothetical protein